LIFRFVSAGLRPSDSKYYKNSAALISSFQIQSAVSAAVWDFPLRLAALRLPITGIVRPRYLHPRLQAGRQAGRQAGICYDCTAVRLYRTRTLFQTRSVSQPACQFLVRARRRMSRVSGSTDCRIAGGALCCLRGAVHAGGRGGLTNSSYAQPPAHNHCPSRHKHRMADVATAGAAMAGATGDTSLVGSEVYFAEKRPAHRRAVRER
jgi:hypothetical protein